MPDATVVPMPNLDALQAAGRRVLAQIFGRATVDTNLGARKLADAAAGIATQLEWDGRLTNLDVADPIDQPEGRLRVLLTAFAELRDFAATAPHAIATAICAADAQDQILASHRIADFARETSGLVDIAELDPSNEDVDAAAVNLGLVALRRAVAGFLIHRRGGLLEDAKAMLAGDAAVMDLLADLVDKRVAELGLHPGAFERDEDRPLDAYPSMPRGTCLPSAEALAVAFPELTVVRGELVYVWREDGETRRLAHAWCERADGQIVDATAASVLSGLPPDQVGIVYRADPTVWADR